jgi:glycosyltransferase involved in cell wall biosynthesis
VTPNKLYGILAAGRPVLFIGEPESALAALVRQHDVGAAFTHGGGAELASELRRLVSNPERIGQMQRNARRLFEREYTRGRCTAKWKDLIARVAKTNLTPDTV